MGKGGGPSAATQAAETSIAQEEVQLGQSQDARAQQLFDIGLPGLQTATSHYQDLASGDPTALYKAVAPATTAIADQGAKAKQNLSETMPRGGARDLAMAETDISTNAGIGNEISQSYNNSFGQLAALAGKNVGMSANDVATAISAFGGASNTYSNVAQQQEASKASTMAFIASMGGAAAQGIGAAA